MAEIKKYLHTLDIGNNKIINLLLNPLTTSNRTTVGSSLTIADEGYVCYDTDEDLQYFWDGSTWIASGGGGTQTLQDVTDLGNTTTNNIELLNAAELMFGAGGGILLDNGSRLREGTIDANTGGSKGIAQICGIGYELKWEAGSLYVMNGNGNGIRQSLYNFTTIPTVTDDSSLGYAVGSLWTLDDGTVYECADATNGAAVWNLVNQGTVTSVGLSMPSAFTVTNSPVTTSGTIAVTGAGTVSQYVRGDGTLANFPNSTGGGASVNYYLNGSISQGTFGGDTYYQMSKTPVLGAGTNFIRTNGAGNGYIASFITDAGDPSFLNIPGGNWNLEFYFQSSASGGSPQFYGEIYKVSVTNVFTLVASGSSNPEGITNGTTIDQYFTSIPVPQTSLLITDRLAIRIYVITGGRTITLHTEDNNLCQIITTFTTGLTALNGLTDQVQYFATPGNTGTSPNWSSVSPNHTLNIPLASTASVTAGLISKTDYDNFTTAYTDRLKWDGGATGLVAATGRTSLGATTVGGNFFTLTNPSAITFPRINADNTVSTLDAATFRTAIGAGTSSTSGTVTNVTATLPISVATGTTTPAISITDASILVSGVVSTGTQTFTGAKTFNATLTTSSTFVANSTITATSSGHRFGNLQIDTSGTAGTTGRGIVCGTTGASTESMKFYSGITATVPDCFSFDVYSGTGRSLTGSTTRNFFSINGGTTNALVNSAICNILNIAPTYNNSGSVVSNTVRGIFYNPTLTSLTGTTHIGMELVSGSNYLNSTSGNTGIGLASGATITDKLTVAGNLNLNTAGNKIKIATGSNASLGTATLVSGTVTISTSAVTSSSIIFVIYNTPSGTLASGLSAPTASINNGVSFVINSLTTAGVVNVSDNSTVNWWIIN